MKKPLFILVLVICTNAVTAQALDIYNNDGSFVRQYMRDINIIKIIQAGGIPCEGTPTVDYEGKTYNTVQIYDQCWLQRNLDVGTMIQGTEGMTDNSTIEKYCYDNDPLNCDTYGGLYQWDEAMDYVTTEGAQGICPSGWHIPTSAELEFLRDNVGASGNALKELGQGTGAGAGTNTSGFSALLAGLRYYGNGGGFNSLELYTHFWSSTEYNASNAYSMRLHYNDDGVHFNNFSKIYGFNVRCLKD